MTLRPIDWSEPVPVHTGSDLVVSYGTIGGLRVAFVMGQGDDWHLGPMFGAEGTPREIALYGQNTRRSLAQAQADAHTLVSMYVEHITEE